MFKRLTTKIFVGFALLVFIEAGVLAYVFGKAEVRSVETYLLENLSKRVETKTHELSKNMKLYRIDQENPSRDQLPDFFSRSHLQNLLPPSGTSATPCLTTDQRAYYCGFSFEPKLKIWAFDFVAVETLSEAILRRLQEIAPFILLFLLGSVLLTFILSRFLLSPLKRFAKASEAIAKGRYEEVELPLQRDDEIGELASGFQRMILDLKERETNLKISGMKLAHSARLASVGQMGASIAHEVKNPLTSMMGYAKILMTKASDPEVREAAEVIQKECERCNQILQQMLRFARSDPAESKPYALREVVQSVLLLVKAEARARQIELRIENILDTIVVGSAQQIQQVLINLIQNAFHASKAGSSIVIRMIEENGHVLIQIEDQGSGIPQDVQAKIFEPFFTTKMKDGTGLGLSVAQDIIQQQGGELSFTSEEGKGSVFKISLALP